ncbi:DUF4367 domain-containing protein [Paenibacillus lautus]|uniref:DUF4367 domain-containing protein n=1 Tax=Paenibacillus lautus TaxID=1401 RepID=UPI0039873849
MEFQRDDVEEKLRERHTKSRYVIDVRDAVMEQIASLPAKKRKPSLYRRPLVMAASLLLVTSLSVTVYAAAELVQIRSKEGKVVLETKPEPEGSKKLQAKQDRLYSLDTASRSSAFRSALPGQAIAYYIHNQEINELKREIHGKETLLEFHAGSLHLGDLGVFREEAEKRGMPDIHIPSKVLHEYSFHEGMLSFTPDLSDLFQEGEPTKAYYDIQNELIRKAEESTGSKRVFVKEIKPPTAGSISLSYVKGSDMETSISVIATKRSAMNSKQEIHYTDKDHVEKVLADGQEMIYVHYADAYFNQGLAWVDEAQDLYYHIALNSKAKLTKENMIEIAEGFIN